MALLTQPNFIILFTFIPHWRKGTYVRWTHHHHKLVMIVGFLLFSFFVCLIYYAKNCSTGINLWWWRWHLRMKALIEWATKIIGHFNTPTSITVWATQGSTLLVWPAQTIDHNQTSLLGLCDFCWKKQPCHPRICDGRLDGLPRSTGWRGIG